MRTRACSIGSMLAWMVCLGACASGPDRGPSAFESRPRTSAELDPEARELIRRLMLLRGFNLGDGRSEWLGRLSQRDDLPGTNGDDVRFGAAAALAAYLALDGYPFEAIARFALPVDNSPETFFRLCDAIHFDADRDGAPGVFARTIPTLDESGEPVGWRPAPDDEFGNCVRALRLELEVLRRQDDADDSALRDRIAKVATERRAVFIVGLEGARENRAAWRWDVMRRLGNVVTIAHDSKGWFAVDTTRDSKDGTVVRLDPEDFDSLVVDSDAPLYVLRRSHIVPGS